MQKSENPGAVVAQEMIWTFRPNDEAQGENDFYRALAPTVAAELSRQLPGVARLWVGREMQLRIGSYVLNARLDNIEPLLATRFYEKTRVVAVLREDEKEAAQTSAFLAETIRYPQQQAAAVFEALVGIDEIKVDLYQKLALLLGQGYSESWARKHYGEPGPQALLDILRSRYPLFVLEGDVGSGKTALARSIGDRIAQRLQTPVVLMVMNAQVRGGGHVGEMTQNIARAFAEAERREEREQVPTLILIDEADTLAQARGSQQTHHEDDAGVNTLIQRIDRLRGKRMAVLFATNLAQSLDSAILRRAAASYHFSRPTPAQRAELLARILAGSDFSQKDIKAMVQATEPRAVPGFGIGSHRYTYSDLTQRVVPTAVEAAIWAQEKLTLALILKACERVLPTPELPANRVAAGNQE